MLKNLTIKAQLIFLAIFMSFLVITIGVMGLRNMARSNETLSRVHKDRVVLLKNVKDISDIYVVKVTETLNNALGKNISMQQASLELEEYNQKIESFWLKFVVPAKKAASNEDEIEIIDSLDRQMKRVDRALRQLNVLFLAENFEAVKSYIPKTLLPLLEPVTISLSKIMDQELKRIKNEFEMADEMYVEQRKISGAYVGIGVFLTAIISFMLVRTISGSLKELSGQLERIASGQADLTQRIKVTRNDEVGEASVNFNRFMNNLMTLVKRVQRSGEDVNSSSGAIASTSKRLSETITNFGSSINNAGERASKISSTSQGLVDTVADVVEVATSTSELATAGQSDLTRMEETMSQMEAASMEISSRLAIISEKAANITNVVTTITKIADQTNLLSLNASIEAEKAGEYGLGFAVVAREIRRLADQVALATLDIEQMVKEMKAAVSAGVMEMDKFSEEVHRDVKDVRNISSQLAQIIDQVQTLLPSFELVNKGVQEQAEGAQEISTSMSQLSSDVEHTMDSIEETTIVAKRLNDAAEGLQKEVAGFQVDEDSKQDT
jgi:methyl-accepting chemotaxis protein WspA